MRRLQEDNDDLSVALDSEKIHKVKCSINIGKNIKLKILIDTRIKIKNILIRAKPRGPT